MNRDPIEEPAGGCNLYTFVGSGTPNHIDFLGLTTIGGVVTDGSGCCCAKRLDNPENAQLINDGVAYGHKFGLYVQVELQESAICSPCSLKWEEKMNIPYYPAVPGANVDQWSDMTTLINSPDAVWDPFERLWLSTNRRIDANFMYDTPKIGLLFIPPSQYFVNDILTRTLEIKVTLSNAAGCPCSSREPLVKTFKQVLKLAKVQGSTSGSTFNFLQPISASFQ